MNNIPDGRCEVYKICKETIRKTVFADKNPILKMNFEYPYICCEKCAFAERFNIFYKNFAINFEKYCEQTLAKKVKIQMKMSESFRPFGEIMKYFISLNNDRYISVVFDITHYDGYFSKCLRISHVWDTEKGVILPCESFLRKMKLSVRNLRREIFKIIYERIEQGGHEFNYTESRIRRFAHRVNPENFFLVDGGIAFWFPIGTIAPESEGFPAYIIKSEWK